MFPIYPFLFYFFAAMLVAVALMVVISRHPVRAVLFLVAAFFASAVLWMLLRAEFLSLVLIFVYVGAVMTLFLFVIMMLNSDLSYLKAKFVRFLPLGLLVLMTLVALMAWAVAASDLGYSAKGLPPVPETYHNTEAMGVLLYTHYIFPFEVAGLILLVAIIAAISLAFHGRKANTRSQTIREQHRASKQDRLRIVKVEGEKKS